ncbi:MAG: histidine--tRNA ligase [Alphaproteobacteria bacterium]|nr:histidine--tRNA ligase [Alphaproteobacteria bacterium]
MAKIQSVRGTHDIVGETAARHRHVVDVSRNCAQRYGFGDIDTPIFEFTPVFARTMGEGSDVVRKEMYSFTDRGGEDITLRPEFTAGICRAFISGGMQQDLPLKLFAHGPAFRYERPQKGRLRQFHQIDAEILGVEGPGADVEIITLGAEILHDLGVLDRCVLELNTLGDLESRQIYRDALVAYFSDHKDNLSEDSVDRLVRNPLRILDSKDDGDQKIVVDAPLMTEYLNQQSQDFFAAVCEGLDTLGITYNLNQRLVRGLDYYTHTAFEFVTDALGSQGAVIAGGRYDGLIKMLGGPQTPGIGWAGGIERLAMLAAYAPEPIRPIAFVPMGEAAERMALVLCHALRRDGHSVDMAFRGNLNRRLKRANKINACVALILGDDEIAKGMITVRDLDEGGQENVDLDAIGLHLRKLIS